MKTVLITGGGDWADASADLIQVPDDLSMRVAFGEYELWRVNRSRDDPYRSFIEWLKDERSAKDDNTVEVFDDTGY